MPSIIEVLERQLQAAQETLDTAQRALDDAPEDITRERIEDIVRSATEAAEERDRIAGNLESARALHTQSAASREERRSSVADTIRTQLEERRERVEIQVTSEPLTYSRHAPQRSYFLDMARAGIQGDNGARERLDRHSREMADVIARRQSAHQRALSDGLDELLAGLPAPLARAIQDHGMVERRDISRTDGAGGEFVPPIWLMDEFAALTRAGRPFADACRNIPLPAGTDNINIPRITGGSTTAPQTADNAVVSETDITTSSVAAPVRTIAGQQDIAMQLLEQSPMAFDQIVFADLVADYNLQLDTQLISGSGAAGQLLGILNVGGINAVTYTDATPTFPELWPRIGDALNQASTNRRIIPSHIWMHGRRWFWATAQLDAQNRPFIVPTSGGPTNAPMTYMDGFENQGGPVSYAYGRPVMLDLSIPTNLGAGTNEDRIVATRMSDHVLFEGDLRARVLPEVLSGNLTVRLQVYAYCAFTAGRYPAATSVISGTGLIAPVF